MSTNNGSEAWPIDAPREGATAVGDASAEHSPPGWSAPVARSQAGDKGLQGMPHDVVGVERPPEFVKESGPIAQGSLAETPWAGGAAPETAPSERRALEMRLEVSERARLAAEAELHRIRSSWLWRTAGRVRRLLTVGRRTRRLVPQPLHDLVRVRERGGYVVYEVTGPDPHFALQWRGGMPLRPGHHKLTLRLPRDAGLVTRPKLYVDTGQGFTEAEAIRLRLVRARAGRYSAAFILPAGARALRLDPAETRGTLAIGAMSLVWTGRYRHYLFLVWTAAGDHMRSPGAALHFAGRVIKILRDGGPRVLAAKLRSVTAATDQAASEQAYTEWVALHDTLGERDLAAMREQSETFARRPLISIVMPTYNTPERLLREAIDSVRAQTYPFWELCIADDASSEPQPRKVLAEYAALDPRIKVVYRPENGHIARASNSALELASGPWVALLDHDDRLPPHALFCVVDAINRHPDARLFYSDEDKITEAGHRYNPYFKPDWSPELFRSQNMISHLGVYERALVQAVGGFRHAFVGSQDYDLALRCIETLRGDQIVHIPHVLYHWRSTAGSTAASTDEKPYAAVAGEAAVNEHLHRTGRAVRVSIAKGGHKHVYPLPDALPTVSIIIPTRNQVNLLRMAIGSIRERTRHVPYEIIVVDNGSDDAETLDYLQGLADEKAIVLLRDDRPFNYSALNNLAAQKASGDFLLLLNNDIEVIEPDWLAEMLVRALDETVGCVGAKLLYPNGTVQHGGVVLGVGGVASHSHKGFPADHVGYFGRLALDCGVSAVTAACLLVRRRIYEEVGGLNERDLTIAFNDVDFCLRVQRAGYRNIVTPAAVLYHHESVSRGTEDTPEKRQRFESEARYMMEHWGPVLQDDPFYNPNLTLGSDDFGLAFPTRAVKPWLDRTSVAEAGSDMPAAAPRH